MTHEVKIFLENGTETYHAIFTAATLPKLGKEFHPVYDQVPELKVPKRQKGICKSEYLLYLKTKASNIGLNIFDDEDEVKKEVMGARKYRGLSKYMNSDYKFCKPGFLKKSRRKRVWIMSQAIDMFDDAYGYKRGRAPKGLNLLENDWFMGPFYSYNQNFEEGVKKKMVVDDQNDKENFSLYNKELKIERDPWSEDEDISLDNTTSLSEGGETSVSTSLANTNIDFSDMDMI